MNSITHKAFVNEFEKISAAGIVGDILAASLLGQLAMTGAQHTKGIKEALKAGATLKHAFSAPPLPLGKEWKFVPLSKLNNQLKLQENQLESMTKEKSSYEHFLDEQRKRMQTVAMPTGAVVSIAAERKHSREHIHKTPMKG